MHEQEELARLRRENEALKQKLKQLENRSDLSAADAYNAENYFSYLRARAKGKSFYAHAERAWHYGRNSIFLTRIFRFLVLLYEYLQTGAFVLLYTALFLIAIPFVLVFSAVVLILTLALRRRNADKLMAEVQNRVLFILVENKETFDEEAVRAVAKANAERTVILVSPFFFRRRGIGEKQDAYVCYRREWENVYIVRNYFFFYLRKRLRTLPGMEMEQVTVGETESEKEDD